MQHVHSKLRRDIERYRFLRRNISNQTLIALLEEMIAETEAQLAVLDASRQPAFSDGGASGRGPATDPFELSLKTAAMRRQPLQVGDWRLDPESKSATLPMGRQVRLTRGEFELLSVLLTHAGQLLSREDLMMLSQNRPAVPGERTIDVLINRLRRKLEVDPKRPFNIRTVRSEGYVFQPTASEKTE